MNFKKPKNELLQEMRDRAYTTMNNHLNNYKYNYHNTTPANLIDQIAFAVAEGMEDALEHMIDNIYTDLEFEEDIKLRT